MLTASQSEADHVAGLELGADDFVTKPIEPRVLVARIRKQLSRLQVERAPNTGHDNGILDIGSLRLDVSSRSVHVKGQNVPVTTMEFDIFEILVKRSGDRRQTRRPLHPCSWHPIQWHRPGLGCSYESYTPENSSRSILIPDVSSPSALWVTFWQIDEILLTTIGDFECARMLGGRYRGFWPVYA